MDDASPATYADWKAPSEDGAVVIWPDGQLLIKQTRENHKHLASASRVLIQNEPLPSLRTAQRAWLGHQDDEALLFATGHQTELLHPGVWIKNALIDEAAKATGGAAYHFAVDTDSPKHLVLRWPGSSTPLSDDPAMLSADWSGLLTPPTPAHLTNIATRFNASAKDWPFQPLLGEFLHSMRRLTLEAETLDAALVNAIHEIDWKLGLRHHAMIVSPIFHSEPYLALVHHVLSRSCEFAADYNHALAEYRAENKITNPGRPMPDLKQDPLGCEVPFWLDDLSTRTRQRAQVKRVGSGMVLHHGEGDDFELDPTRSAGEATAELLKWLRRHNLRLAPRALMLTTFLRLFVADNFIHGIGGGRYDQVTDKLIASHFRLTPPKFAVTTATLFFPTADQEQRVCLSCLQQEGHRLKHSVLGERKRAMVAAINAAPRHSLERSRAFAEMHHALTAASHGEPLLAWQRRLEEARQRDDRQQQVFDRELFYAIQPPDRLQLLIDLCRQALSS
jgi:hypothetical protein